MDAEEDGAGPSVVVVESDSAGPSATVTISAAQSLRAADAGMRNPYFDPATA